MTLRFILSWYLLVMVPANIAHADWTIVSPDKSVSVAKSTMKVTPKDAWSRWSFRPSSKGEIWTIDGLGLNELTFFSKVLPNETLYNETDGANMPLPKFRKDMLPADLPEFFETSNRIILQSALFKIDQAEPAKLSGHDAVRFRYSYTSDADGLARAGECVAANVDGRLYLVNFVAPKIFYFERDVAKFREIVASLSI
jgi:hypothetical protein